METDLQKLTCSKCGCETVRVFVREGLVVLECTECASTSDLVVVVKPPKIEFRFGKDSQGALSKKEHLPKP
jgi:hypothetical protein